MKSLKKFSAIFLALAMVVGMILPSIGKIEAAPSTAKTTDKVTVHKILQAKKDFEDARFPGRKGKDDTQYVGKKLETEVLSSDGKSSTTTTISGYFGGEAKEIDKVYFAMKWAKTEQKSTTNIVDGVNYTMESHKEGHYVTYNKSSNSYGSVEKIDGSITGGYELLAGPTTTKGLELTTKGLKGDFLIEEIKEKSTYVGDGTTSLVNQKAVPIAITLPLVNNDGIVADAHVYPKNIEGRPKVDKNYETGQNLNKYEDKNSNLNSGAVLSNQDVEKGTATANIGDVLKYEVKTQIDKGTEYENLTWTDSMTNGLTFLINPGVTISATYEGGTIPLASPTDYTLVADDRGFTLKMTDKGLAKINEKANPKKSGTKEPDTSNAKDVLITLKYSAKVNSNAKVDVADKNDIKLVFGHKPGKDIEEKKVTPKNKELIVNKTWSTGEANSVPESVNVVYTLKDNNGTTNTTDDDKTYSVMLDKNTKGTINLGNGIEFEVGTTPFSGKFKGLVDASDRYTISERVAGYTPEYTGSEPYEGTINIKNNKETTNPEPVDPKDPKVITGGKKFVKTNEGGEKRLFGAEFYIKNKDGDKYLVMKPKAETDLDGKKYAQLDKLYKAWTAKLEKTETTVTYNKFSMPELGAGEYDAIDADKKNSSYTLDETGYNNLKKDRDEAFRKANDGYTWSDASSAPNNAVVVTSNKDGQFEIQGLQYGTYNLEEKTPPTGYAKLSGTVKFEVGNGSYTKDTTELKVKYDENLSNTEDALRVINKKVSIPQTGGIGTIIFAVVGLALMGFAAYAMKRNSKED